MSIHPLHIADGVLGVSCGVCKLPHIFKCIEWVGSCVKRKVLMKPFKDKTDDMVENKSEMCLSENSMEHVGRERIDVHTYHTVLPCCSMGNICFLHQSQKQNGSNHQHIAACETGCEE